MLLETLIEKYQRLGYRFTQNHGKHDFVKISFRVGQETPRGLEVKGRLRKANKNKGYSVVGYLTKTSGGEKKSLKPEPVDLEESGLGLHLVVL